VSKYRPVYGNGEGTALFIEIVTQLFNVGGQNPVIGLNGAFEAGQERIQFGLRVCPFDGEQAKVGGREAQVSQRRPIQFSGIN